MIFLFGFGMLHLPLAVPVLPVMILSSTIFWDERGNNFLCRISAKLPFFNATLHWAFRERDASVSGPSGFLLRESDPSYCLLTSRRLAAGFQLTLLCWVSYHLPVCFPSSKTFLTFLISSVAFVGLFLYSFLGALEVSQDT